MYHENQWFAHVFKRTDPGQVASTPETYGNYVYFANQKQYPDQPGSDNQSRIGTEPYAHPNAAPASGDAEDSLLSKTYEIFLRSRKEGNFRNEKEAQEATEVVLDLAEIPWIQSRQLRNTVIHKVKMSDDHSLVAFTVDIGNTEFLTGGVRDMKENRVLPQLMLPNIGQIEFGGGDSPKHLYYTEVDEYNRPCRVKRLNIETRESTTLFTDVDPTHYVDIGVTKDSKFLVISSNTKEDSEIWVLPRESYHEEGVEDQFVTPVKVIKRKQGARAHIDHLRDYFVTITTDCTEKKNFKLATLQDDQLIDGSVPELESWEDLLAPGMSSQDLVITEFDAFKDFLAIYCKKNGVPEILV